MKLQKYLGNNESLARQGYSQGMTETARIAAENSRQKALAAADSEYSASFNNLMNQYRVEKEAEQDKKEAKQDKAYEELMGQIDSTNWKDADSLQKYLYGEDKTLNEGDIAYGLREEQLKNIGLREGEITRVVNSPEYKETKKKEEIEAKFTGSGVKRSTAKLTVSGKHNSDKGQNITVSDGTNNYALEIEEALVVDPENGSRHFGDYDTLMGAYINDGEVFEYDGKLYLREGDTYYRIGNRAWGTKKEAKLLEDHFKKDEE